MSAKPADSSSEQWLSDLIESQVYLLSRQLIPLLIRITKQVTDDLADLLRPWGLTVQQFGVMRVLLGDGPMPSTQVAGRMALTGATMTGIIDRLERDGYVTRGSNHQDRRQVIIALTLAGRELIERLESIPVFRDNALQRALSSLSPDHREQLRVLCYKLAGGLEAGEAVEHVTRFFPLLEGRWATTSDGASSTSASSSSASSPVSSS